MNYWYYYDTDLNTGNFNMDFDLQLGRDFEEDKIPRLRFYRWQPYAISLGFNQDEKDLDIKKIEADGIDVVRRPTGGRAVFHSEELTYSVIFPRIDNNSSVVYSQISNAIVKGFHLYNKELEKVDLEKNQVDFNSFYKSHKSIPCFSSSARYEIKLGERKIVGSAQRAFTNYILQHGSILTGTFHKNLVNYLNLDVEVREQLRYDMDTKTISLGEILNEAIDFERLKLCIKKGFEEYFQIEFIDKLEKVNK